MNTKVRSEQKPISGFMLDERLATIGALLGRSGLTDEQRQRLECLQSLMMEEARLRLTAPEQARRLDTRIRWVERGAPATALVVH